jgi:carbonic anhydrase/acetyltransferase-like protein (isoleucine patch superfamily)
VELGALVVTQDRNPSQQLGQEVGICGSMWPVLGKTVLDRWVERVQALGVGLVSVVDHELPGHVQTIVDWAKGGVEQILLILLGSYAEVDLVDLVQFHHQGQNQITRVFDSQGPLGISLLDRRTVLQTNEPRRNPNRAALSSRYEFLGYVIRLASTVAYRKLVEDALQGRCAIEPAGLRTDNKVWVHPSAQVHPSVQLHEPCYIGAETRIHAGVTIGPTCSVERNCEIDIGTALEQASVLSDTYVAPGLRVRNSVIDGTRLLHLGHDVAVNLSPFSLSSRRKPAWSTESPGLRKTRVRRKQQQREAEPQNDTCVHAGGDLQ